MDPITDNVDHQMLSTISDIRASDRARTTSMAEEAWPKRLARHFPEMASRVTDIQVDWPGRLPNTAIITLNNKRRYLYTSDPNYDHGTLERI